MGESKRVRNGGALKWLLSWGHKLVHRRKQNQEGHGGVHKRSGDSSHIKSKCNRVGVMKTQNMGFVR